MIAFGYVIVGSLGSFVEHTKQEKMDASIDMMIRFGIYGLIAAFIGV